MIISIATQKGGVGKTTVSLSLAAGFARQGHKVLLIDVDPQSNSSKTLIKGIYPRITPDTSLYTTLIDSNPLPILKTSIPNLSLVPAHLKMSKTDLMLATALGRREERIKKQLDLIKHNYDYIFLDCPPSVSFLTINAFAASDRILIVVGDGFFEIDALTEIVQTLKDVKAESNPNLDVIGILYNLADQRTKLHKEILEQIKGSLYKDYLFDTIIPRNVKIGEAHANGLDIFGYAPESLAADAFIKLIEEIKER